MLFGDRIRELRNLKNLSQQELANRSEISLRTIQNYECHLRYPKNVLTLSKLSRALNTTIEDLLEENNSVRNFTAKFDTGEEMNAQQIVNELSSLFESGSLNDEEKDKVFRIIIEMYRKSKIKSI